MEAISIEKIAGEVSINVELMEVFTKKVEKFNRRAAKIGVEGVSFRVIETAEHCVDGNTFGAYPRVNAKGLTSFYAMYNRIEVVGSMPVVEGYRFIATIDMRGDTPVVRPQPGVEEKYGVDLKPYFKADCWCDHCKSRRQRNDLLVLQNIETGALIQIGRNCAADFFRTKDAVNLLSVRDWFDSVSSGYEGEMAGGGSVNYLPLDVVMQAAAAAVRVYGYVSSSMAKADDGAVSTRSATMSVLFPPKRLAPEERVTITTADVAEAEAAVAWLMADFVGKPETERSVFENNVVAVIEAKDTPRPAIRIKNMAFVVWAIDGYKRERQRRIEREAVAKNPGAYVGTIGQRVELSLTLRIRRTFSGTYGPTALCIFSDAEGNTLIWRGSSDAAFRMKIDHAYKVKGTVKDHKLREDIPQTELTRVAVIEGELEDA